MDTDPDPHRQAKDAHSEDSRPMLAQRGARRANPPNTHQLIYTGQQWEATTGLL